MAMAAWSARRLRSCSSSAVHAWRRRDCTVSVPMGPSVLTSGAVITERIPRRSMYASSSGECPNAVSAR